MEASRRQPGMLEGLSRFLVQHERCGAGFDVAHPAGLGSGRVSITCRGCGARHEYATATIEVERELKIERRARPAPTPPPIPPPPAEPRAPIPPRPAPYPESTRPSTPRPAADAPPPTEQAAGGTPQAGRARGPAGAMPAGAASSAWARIPARPTAPQLPRPAAADSALSRFWRSPRATLLLVVVAAIAIGIAVVRFVNQGGGQSQGTHVATGQPQTTSPPTPAQPPSGPVAQPTPAPGPQTTAVRTSRFSVEAPRGWIERTSAGGLLLEPRGGGRANVQIFFQRSPGLSEDQMARQTANFLRSEVPGARLFPRRIRVGGRSAQEITARGPGETAIAVDVLRGPYRYLLVRRIFAGASPHVSVAASRVVLSFRPR